MQQIFQRREADLTYYEVLPKRGVSTEMNAKTASQGAEPAIQFRNVTYSINGSAGQAIVSNIVLTVSAGETLVLLGRSGSGKTTLLNLINRLLLPASGHAVFPPRPTSASHPIPLRRGLP